jgi:hypothetical protein
MQKLSMFLILLTAASYLYPQQPTTVVKVKQAYAVINKGANHSVKAGDRFKIQTPNNPDDNGEVEVIKTAGSISAVKLVKRTPGYVIKVGDREPSNEPVNDFTIADELLDDAPVERNEDRQRPHIGQETQEKNKLESWYVYFGLGYANPTYPGELDDLMNDLADLPGVTHVSIGMDIIGFYWPLGRHTILGGVINAVGDRYEESGDYIQINGYTLGGSIMHFFNDTIGRGFFIRGDLGLAGFVVDTNFGGDESSETGVGFLAGGGYGFNISRGTRLLLNANFAVRQVEGESFSAFGLTVGGLF